MTTTTTPLRSRLRRIAAACALLTALGSPTATWAAPTTTSTLIKIDQFGYLPTMRKVAILADPQVGWNAAEAYTPGTGSGQIQVRRWADDAVVLSLTAQAWKSGATHTQSGDRGWQVDFSALTTPGSYYLFDTLNNVGSHRFEIGTGVYDAVLKQALRTFYYQRLNFAKAVPYADARWADGASYERANQDRQATSRWAKGVASTARDLSGGWADAGDTNKYTTFAQEAVLLLLDAYRMNPAVFGDANGIPESGNGLPDLLDEVKVELEFLKRMQNASGTNGLFLKVGLDTYDGDVTPPSSDTRPRYYLPECSSATLAGSAMFGAASVVYKAIPSQASYAADLLTRAEAAWARTKTTTANFTTFETTCDDGDIKAGDADVDAEGQRSSALLAAISLYEATGKAEYRSFVEANYSLVQPVRINWWGPYWAPLQVALLRYAGLSGVSNSVATAIRSQKANQNGTVSITDYSAGTDLYRAYLADSEFNWGHNKTRSIAGAINLDFVQFGINPANATLYQEVAQQHLHWLHGANPLGLVMLSNMAAYGAESSVSEIFHNWFRDGSVWDSAKTSTYGPPPGYLTGGPNRTYTGSVAGLASQPPQKAYKDWNSPWPENSWEVTEPAIYYQAAYIQLLARLMPNGAVDSQAPTAPTALAAAGVTATGATLSWKAATDNVGVSSYELYNGSSLVTGGLTGTSATLTSLYCGSSYSFTLKARDAAGNLSAASNAITVKTSACPTAATLIYTDSLAATWADWSWSATRNFANTTPIKVGTKSLRADLQGWGGVSLRHGSGIAASATATLRFWAYSSSALPLRISVQTQDSAGETGAVTLTLAANTWTDVILTRAQLGNPNLVKRINLQLMSASAGTLYLDQIQLTK
ncbi:MAG TPA: glycoside hydrolase family 9 protein [Burkholderiaceae bacterium]|nr:glycoside hydrolase family 9 protein [Burkholderiaceae bacterium]HMX09998.1 glycoside hydrolase family 9 protein [Burkholderiaceae bacterium]HNB43792.1 glycoside hydrolase family 9 protein [Burkholderiaceae bacterium]HNG79470.1 glycoside hydrolase family 9 protein [Burkholderiaceae bacterium]